MRKKVSVSTIQRENGEKENHEVSQTALDKRVNSGSEAPLNGNHNNNSDLDDHDDDNFDEEEKGDDCLPGPEQKSENQEELP